MWAVACAIGIRVALQSDDRPDIAWPSACCRRLRGHPDQPRCGELMTRAASASFRRDRSRHPCLCQEPPGASMHTPA